MKSPDEGNLLIILAGGGGAALASSVERNECTIEYYSNGSVRIGSRYVVRAKLEGQR
jgi:hypothetical protein